MIAMTDEVARSWPDLEEQARQDATRLELLTAAIWYRTDTGSFGTLSLAPERSYSLTDEPKPTNPYRGTIISASADPEQISREVRAEHRPD